MIFTKFSSIDEAFWRLIASRWLRSGIPPSLNSRRNIEGVRGSRSLSSDTYAIGLELIALSHSHNSEFSSSYFKDAFLKTLFSRFLTKAISRSHHLPHQGEEGGINFQVIYVSISCHLISVNFLQSIIGPNQVLTVILIYDGRTSSSGDETS